MFPPQAKLPSGERPPEVSESWENVAGRGCLLERSFPGYQEFQQIFPGEGGVSERGPLGALAFLDPSHGLSLGHSP